MTDKLKELKAIMDAPEVIHRNPFEKFPNALIFIIAGVSGVGKTTVVRSIAAIKIVGRVVAFVVTYTNRAPRSNKDTGMEVDGVNYFFVSTEKFNELIAQGFFAEHEEVYPGRFYGTSYNQLHQIAGQYGFGVTDLDVKGAKVLKAEFPNNIYTIFLEPESEEQAITQLKLRAEAENVSGVEVEARISRFKLEFAEAIHFDERVVSVAGNPKVAFDRITEIMAREITKRLPKP